MRESETGRGGADAGGGMGFDVGGRVAGGGRGTIRAWVGPACEGVALPALDGNWRHAQTAGLEGFKRCIHGRV